MKGKLKRKSKQMAASLASLRRKPPSNSQSAGGQRYKTSRESLGMLRDDSANKRRFLVPLQTFETEKNHSVMKPFLSVHQLPEILVRRNQDPALVQRMPKHRFVRNPAKLFGNGTISWPPARSSPRWAYLRFHQRETSLANFLFHRIYKVGL